MTIVGKEERGGAGRRKVLDWLQTEKRERELPQVLKKLDAQPAELMAAIRKKAKVDAEVTIRKMTPSQRYAMRNAALIMWQDYQRKSKKLGEVFVLLMNACTTDEPQS